MELLEPEFGSSAAPRSIVKISATAKHNLVHRSASCAAILHQWP